MIKFGSIAGRSIGSHHAKHPKRNLGQTARQPRNACPKPVWHDIAQIGNIKEKTIRGKEGFFQHHCQGPDIGDWKQQHQCLPGNFDKRVLIETHRPLH